MKTIRGLWVWCFFVITFGLLALAGPTPSAAGAEPQSNSTAAPPDHRLDWWREARLGMFIHWGLYSVAAGEWNGQPTGGAGEWIMNDQRIPVSQYRQLVSRFNPVKFDAREWVRIARDAGMKYIVITTKHHDGFALYPTALTDWSMKATPFQRDPLKELAAACQEAGIKLCFYHSIMDWHHPDYAPRKSWNDLAEAPPRMDAYVDFLKGELKELLTGYGPIGLLWFDGQWENTWTYERGADLYHYVRGLQPNLIVNNRVGTEQPLQGRQTRMGDYKTPEQTIPANGLGPGVAWETCMTMNNTWGFKQNDQDWKSTTTLVRNLIDCASKGGNYLLNVGPTGEGLIPAASIERLKQMGEWMRANGVAVYGTDAGPFARPLPWGRCTTRISGRTTTLYLHVFDWPNDGKLFVPGLKSPARSAWLLTDSRKQPLRAKSTPEGLTLTVPPTAPDQISSTVVVQIQGAPRVEVAPLRQGRDGSVRLAAMEARLHGSTFQYEAAPEHRNIGYWIDPGDWLDWEFQVHEPGEFVVTAETAAMGNGQFEVLLDGQVLRGSAPRTEGYTTFTTVTLGQVRIPAKGAALLAVQPIREGWQPINLRAIRLERIGPAH